MDFFDSISHNYFRSQDAATIERLRQERQPQKLILMVISVQQFEDVVAILVRNDILMERVIDGHKTYPLTRKGERLARLEAENG